MSKATTLEDRIADAFAAQHKSADLAALLEEVGKAEEKARADHSAAKDVALDPATRPAAVAAARKTMEDAEFASSRLMNATEKLKQLVTDAQSRERETARREEHAAALAERDELAKDLKEFAELTDRMVALLTRLSRNNRRLGGDHRSAGPERGAEAIARGVPGLGHSEPSIVDSTKLITFDGRQYWPPLSKNMWTEYP